MTVCIPSIPTRGVQLQRALVSITRQTLQPVSVIVATDITRTGAAATRQRALDCVKTPLVAFLDDDDELWPRHLELCVEELRRTDADLVYPWFEVIGGSDPFVDRYKKPFSEEDLRTLGQFIPITVVARTEAIRAAGPFREAINEYGWTNEDYNMWISMLDNGCTFVHLPRTTWSWWHHGANTSGNPRNW